jgi:hypothetical protein
LPIDKAAVIHEYEAPAFLNLIAAVNFHGALPRPSTISLGLLAVRFNSPSRTEIRVKRCGVWRSRHSL